MNKKTLSLIKYLLSLILVFSHGTAVWAMPENYLARKELSELFSAPASEVYAARARVFEEEPGFPMVKFSVERQRDAFYLLFLNERNFLFPQYGMGSYIIKRNIRDGSLVQIKIFLKDDPGCFLRLFPSGNRSRMDIYLYDQPVYRSVPLPLPLYELLSEPFSRIVDLTRESVRWDLIMPDASPEYHRKVQNMAESFIPYLSGLGDADDGAMEANGLFVRINDGSTLDVPGMNCSGFSKWILDSVYGGLTGRYLPIADLTVRHIGLRGNRWSDQLEFFRDPHFGLDWIRNGATILRRLDQPGAGFEDSDVRRVPFFTYIEDVGFPIEKLMLLLYFLAAENPGFFYLGSVNGPFGTDQVLRQHYHVAALFPYLDPQGNLQVVLLERNQMNEISSFINRYPKEYIHLVRVKAREDLLIPYGDFFKAGARN